MDDINATMSEVARRVAKLERAMPGPGENKFLRVGAVAGVLGTIISISVGMLGVWQAQTEAQEARYAKFVSAQPGRGVIGSDAVVTAFLMAV